MQKKENIREMETEVEQSDLDSEITSEITFLQEKIKERPVNRRKLVRRTVITVVMAMVFGVVACVTFLLLEPVINRMIYPEKETEIVRFPEEEEEVSPEDMAADEEELQIIREEEAAGNKEDGSEDPDGKEITATEGETTTEAPGDKEGTGSGENTPGEISLHPVRRPADPHVLNKTIFALFRFAEKILIHTDIFLHILKLSLRIVVHPQFDARSEFHNLFPDDDIPALPSSLEHQTVVIIQCK